MNLYLLKVNLELCRFSAADGVLLFKPSLLFHFSHAGLDVRLLDPPEHVPDPEVPGDYRRRNFPCRKPHAGPESSEEVRPLMIPGTNGSQRVLNLREEVLAPFRRQGPGCLKPLGRS